MASLLDILIRTAPLILAGVHAFLESRAAGNCADSASDPPCAEPNYSLLWLVSCTGFAAYELWVGYSTLSLAAITGRHAILCAIGAALFACGVYLRLAAMRDLKSAFGRPPWAYDTAHLKRDGLFAQVRHPSELGFLTICLGLAAMSNSAAAVGIFAFVLLPLCLLRVRQEERWLLHKTAGAYAAYAACVPCLFPIVTARRCRR